MASIGGNLRMMFPPMAEHNRDYPYCNPLYCDTLDEFARALEEWVEQLPDPMRLQMTCAMLKAAMNVSRRHAQDEWQSIYRNSVQCS